jgi:type I restriction enzyme S subunit
MPKGWKTFNLGDFININPKISLKKGGKYSFIEMKDLDASRKYVTPLCKKTLTGGAKFCNGDTLFARITPCLENGKSVKQLILIIIADLVQQNSLFYEVKKVFLITISFIT